MPVPCIIKMLIIFYWAKRIALKNKYCEKIISTT